MIHVSQQELGIILTILEKHLPWGEVLVFGSRCRGSHKPYSDLDLAVRMREKMSLAALGSLQEDFAGSELPFRVEVLDYWGISPEFRKAIDQEYTVIYRGAAMCL